MQSLPSAHTDHDRLRARLATVDQLRVTLLTRYLDPVPSTKTLHAWFRRAAVPRFQANPAAVRGGGPVYYSVAAIEKLIRKRTGHALDEIEGGAR